MRSRREARAACAAPVFVYATVSATVASCLLLSPALAGTLQSVVVSETASLVTIGGAPVNTSDANLTVVAPHDSSMKVHRTSVNGQVIYEYGPTASEILQSESVDSASWRDERQGMVSFATLAKDALGLVPFANIDTALGVGQLVQDVIGMLNDPAVGPSNTLNAELGSDDYAVYNAYVAGSLLRLRAVRFSVDIDILGNTLPHFFLKLKQHGAATVGIEIRDPLDVPIITKQ